MPYSVTAPAEKAYGTEQDAYLRSLLPRDGAPPGVNGLNQLNLMMQARGNDPDAYEKAYAGYLANQRAGAQAENVKDAWVARQNNLAPQALAGVSAATGEDGGVDTNYLRAADAVHQNAKYLSGIKDAGAGVKDLTAGGVTLPLGYLSKALAAPNDPNKVPVGKGANFGGRLDKEDADAKMKEAEAAMLHAQKYDGHQGGTGDSTQDTVQMIKDAQGNWVPMFKTTVAKHKGGGGAAEAPAGPAVPKTIIDPVSHRVVANPAYKGP